ncbi:MAG: DNA-binding protein [Balneola sp.]|nr:DNA-binding protein [Balneola sp.]|tara:strand:+ start:29058 stop:29480 length:423 start_codon:yes stop_codon:yes gene_type:complete
MLPSFRKNLKYILPVVILIMVFGLILSRVYTPDPGIPEPEIRIHSDEAKDHIGKAAEVCGMTASVRFIPEIGGAPTFINFGLPDPNQTFTAVIWGENRSKWESSPESIYPEQEICVNGRIESHEGTPQIEVRNPEQIRLN